MKRIITLALVGLMILAISPAAFARQAVTGSTSIVVHCIVPGPDAVPPQLVRPIARQNGYQLEITYTYGESLAGGIGPVNGAGVAMTVPNDFPPPSLNATDPGFVAVAGTAAIAGTMVYGRTVVAFVTSASPGQTVIFMYGNAAGQLTMPSRPNRYTFNVTAKMLNSLSPYPSGFQTVMPSPQLNVLTNMTPATVIFTPDTALQNCQADVMFQLGAGEVRSLFKGDRIRIWFDWDVNNPTQTITSAIAYPNVGYLGLNVPLNLKKEAVKVNGMTCTISPTVTYVAGGAGAATAQIDIYVPQDIRCTTTTGQVVKVTIDKSGGMMQGTGNPPATSFSRFARIATITNNLATWIEPDTTLAPNPTRMYSNIGGDYLNSNNYEIKTRLNTSTPSPMQVAVSPPTVDQEAQYTIGAVTCGVYGSFQIGQNGTLTQNLDTITIEFPAGTRVPSTISPASILVQVVPLGIPTAVNQPPVIQGNKVTFKVPVQVNANECIVVTFLSTAHIINPSVGAADYNLKVYTSKETTIINSLNYQIENPGWAVVNVTPNLSFSDGTSVVVSTAGECFKYGSNDADTTGAKYTIQFSLSESCRITQNVTQINIQFDSVYGSTNLLPLAFVAPPGGPGNAPINSVLVNNIACSVVGSVIVNAGTSTISIVSPVDIAPGSQVTVVFQPSAQIENPDIDGETENYVIKIAIPGCQPEIISQSYFIKTEVSNVNLVNFYPGAPPLQPQNFVPAVNSISPWIIDFCLGDYGNGGINVPNLLPGDTITVTFPEGTSIPATINTNGVYLYIGRPAPGGQQIQLINARVDGNKIIAQLPSVLPAPGMIFENERLTIVFPDTLQIKTPPTAGSYFVTVQTSKETTPVQSAYFMIGTVVQKDSVVVTPNTSSSVDESCAPGYSEYTIRFRTGQYGSLMPSTDSIYVVFPLGFTVPGAFPFDSVILNGVSVPGPSIVTFPAPFPYTGTMIQIPVQNYMPAGSLVELTFLKIANIRNPFITQNPSLYTFKMNTTAEPAWIESNPFEIISKICMNCTTPNSSVHFAGPTSALTSTSIMMGEVDGWLIGFQPGDMGLFELSKTTVTIEFPPGTVVPSLIPPQYIRCFNSATLPGLFGAGAVCSAGTQATYVTVNGQKVTIMFPDVGVLPGPTVPAYVYFCEEANIQAPMVPGNYSVKAWTSKEPNSVESCQFSVQARGMAPAKVVAEPSTAGAQNVKYTITFQTGPFGAIGVGDTIKIDFGDYAGNASYLTNIAPPGFSSNLIPAMYVTVNGKECMLPIRYQPFNVGPPMNGLSFYVQSPVAIPAGGTAKIVFSPNCRIINPTAWSPDSRSPNYYLIEPLDPNYRVKISTNKEIIPVESEEYEITRPDATTRPIITNSPCVAGLPSTYGISFVTPVPLNFVAATPLTASWIEIEFPEGFYLPSSMLADQIMVNEYKLAVPPIINQYTVTIRTPTPIPAWGTVNIKFDPSLMLYNPNLAGKYIIRTRVDGAAQFISGEYTVCEQINISRVEIVPSGPLSLPMGGTQQFNAKVFDTQGQLITENLEVNWSFGSNIGYISPIRGLQTTFTAFNQGTGVLLVAATYGNRTMTATANITVTGRAASLIINPVGPSSLIKNQCFTYCAQLYDNSVPPSPILSGVTYSWQLSYDLGSLTPKDGKCTSFCPTTEGAADIICTATYMGDVITTRSQFTVKSGINSLIAIPTTELGSLRATQLSPELSFEIRNDVNQPVSVQETTTVTVECTSPTGRFTLDKIRWSDTNKITLQIVKGFSKTQSFYFADSTPGNVTITATAVNTNPASIKATIIPPTSRILFTNESRVTSAGAASPPLTLAIKDDFGQNAPPASDTIITLAAYRIDANGQVSTSQSATGTFSLSDTAWSPLPSNTITMRQGQPTIDFFYKDLVTGTYLIKATTVFHGMAAQQIVVTTAGSVGGNLIVNVEPATARLPAKYFVEFRVGASGALGLGIGHIYLQFPKGTEIPGLSQAEVKVNGAPCQVIPIIDRTKNVIDIVTPVDIRPNTDVKIEIPRLTNPPEGTYTLIIWTSAETQPTTSVPYIIGISTVQRLRVKVIPNSVGLEATYLIEFRTGPSGVINVGDNITIQFPVGTTLPSLVEARYVKVNGVLCLKSPTVTGLQMIITNPMAAQADSDVTIEIDTKAGVRNPPIPKNDYVLKLATVTDAKLVDSAPYEIVAASTVSNVKVNVQPPTVFEKAKYTITFTIGANGTLLPGDEIYIQMNEQTLPTSIAALYVSVNGINPPSDPIVDGKRIKIRLSAGIAAGQQVVVAIEAAGGIKNPPNPGSDYRISVFTSKEPYPVNSDPFTLESSIIVEHSIEPSAPNGERSWYTVTPTVTLKMNGSGQIKYKYEGEQSYNSVYTGPFKVEKTGQVIIYYKGISQSGVESAEKMIVIKIDPTPPSIRISSPGDSVECTKVKEQAVSIMGTISDINDVELMMNGQNVPVRSGVFSVTVTLVSGLNKFTFIAKDFAGNQTTKVVCIELKNKPPVLSFDEPSFMAKVTGIEFPETSKNVHQLKMKLRVKGTTEPGITQVSVTPITVPGASQTIPVTPEGRFDKELVFDAIAGLNELSAEVVDTLGNKATQKLMPVLYIDFKLPINNPTANLNGFSVTLQSPPYIVSGRTMVPFRIMAESLGAKVGYDAAQRMVSFELGTTKINLWIGKNTASVTVGGATRSVKLDAVPVIKNNVTMVPFRFVAENLGAKVTWNAATRTAQMTYP